MDDFAAQMELLSQNSTAPMDMDPAERERANAAWAEAQEQPPAQPPGQALAAPRRRLTSAECNAIMRRVMKRWQQKRAEDLDAEDPDELDCITLYQHNFVRQYSAGQLDEDAPYPNRPRILLMQELSRDPRVRPKQRKLRLWQSIAAQKLLVRGSSTQWSRDNATGILTPNASLLAVHDVGLGKTITAILALASVYQLNPNPEKYKALIVVPKSVLQIWYKTLQSWTTLSGRIFVLRKEADINGLKLGEEAYTKKRFQLAHVVLTTPDTITQAFKTFMEDEEAGFGKRRTKPRSACLRRKKNERLREAPVHELFSTLRALSLLVIDEIHLVKGRNNWAGIVLRIWAKRAFYKLGLTGTPVANDPEELADLAKVLNVKDTFYHDYDAFRKKDTGDLEKSGVDGFREEYMDRVDVTFAMEELPDRRYLVLHYDPFVGLLPDGTMNVEAIREHNAALAGLRSILKTTKDTNKSWGDADLEALDQENSDARKGLQEEDGSGDVAAAAPQGKEAKEKKANGSKVLAFQKKIEQAEFSTVLAKYGATKFSSSSTKADELQKMLEEAADDAPSEVMALIARVIMDRQAAGHMRIAVFSESVAVHLILMRFLEGKDVGQMFLFDSSVGDATKRADLVRDFKECEKGVLLFTVAGGVGITLSPECAVMLSVGPLGWSPAATTQAFGRVYRIGAVTPVEIIQFVARRSLTAIKMNTHEDKRDRLGKAVVDADYSEFSGALDRAWKKEKEPLASLVPLDEESGNYLVLERQVAAMRMYQDQLDEFMAGKRREEPEKPVGWPQAPVPPSRMPLPPVSFPMGL